MSGWSNVWIMGLIALLCIIATWATYRILKEEERKQQDYKEGGSSAKDELARSLEYEQKSLKKNVPVLSWIYIVTIVVSLLVFVVYLFNLLG